jgi:membrane protein
MPVPRPASQTENLVAWFAASVLVAAGVIYALRNAPERATARPHPIAPRATPAQEPLAMQKARAAEAGRGRQAHAPVHIPWRGWKDILVRTYYEILDDRLLAVAAGVVFYSLLALFPAIAAGVSIYALFANAATIAQHLNVVANIVPAGVLDLISGEISRLAAKSDNRLTLGFLVGLAVALWSANASMKAIFDALNIIYDEGEKRGLIWLNVVSLFFTVCAIAAAALAVGAVVVFPLLQAKFGLTSINEALLAYLRWPILFVLIILGVAVLNRYGPSRRIAKWRGSASAASLPHSAGWRCHPCSRGISPALPITTPPTARLARPSA